MRILFIAPYTPNPIRVRPYEFLRALLHRGHEVTLATLYTSAAEQFDLDRLAEMGVRVLAQQMPVWRSGVNCLMALPTRSPLQSVYSWQPDLFQSLWALVQTQVFDAVHIEHLRGSRYGAELLRCMAAQGTRPPVVWDSVDCISHLFTQAAAQSRSTKGKLMTRFELPRTERYEGQLVHLFDHTVVTSKIDKSALAALADRAGADRDQPTRAADDAISVVPNGVDLDHFAFCGSEQRHANRIVFSGKMSYHANVTAALHLINDIMPLVWAQRPDAEVWLVGKDPAPELRALAEAAARAAGGPADGAPADGAPARRIVVTGEVPAMQDYIQSAAVAVAPLLYGAGIQNKVLEAMACGAPVVASPQASQSLTARPDHDFLLAATPGEAATAILALLASPAQRAELGRAGRRFVETHHSWDSAARQLEEIYLACADRLVLQPITP
jgi:glycosyltransferase involved in cell wall biosynthesis